MSYNHAENMAIAQTTTQLRWKVVNLNNVWDLENNDTYYIYKGKAFFVLGLFDQNNKGIEGHGVSPLDVKMNPSLKEVECTIQRTNSKVETGPVKLKVGFGQESGSVEFEFTEFGEYKINMLGLSFMVDVVDTHTMLSGALTTDKKGSITQRFQLRD